MIEDTCLYSLKFLLQLMPFCTLAGCGMVLAGNYLHWIHHSGRLTHPSLLVMIPPLIGVKGNVEMTFSSRISAIANTQLDTGFSELFHLILSNFLLSFVLAVTGGIVVATLALALCASETLTLSEAAQSFSVTIWSSSFASILIGFCMLVVIFMCKRCKVDPDNVAAPLAAALGDSMVLFIMTGVLWLIDSVLSSAIFAHLGTVICLLVAFGPALKYLRVPRTESCLGANSTTLRCCLLPLFIAVCLSSVSGRLLASYVNKLPNLARLQPVINGVGGNLASVLISRMTTRLSAASHPVISEGVSSCIHRVGFLSCAPLGDELGFKHRRSPAITRRISEESDAFTESFFSLVEDQLTTALSHGGSAETTLVAVRVAISDSVLTGRNLLLACIPLHLILMVANSALSHLFSSMGLVEPTAPVATFSPAVILAHISASFFQIFVLLNFARWLITHQWLYLAKSSNPDDDAAGRLASLDLMAISITTGLGDLLGTSLLTLALLAADS